MTAMAQAGKKRTIGFYLAPRFSMIAFTTAVEPLRIANRLAGEEIYTWYTVSADGEAALASNGLHIEAHRSLEMEQRAATSGDAPDLFIVCAGMEVTDAGNRQLRTLLRTFDKRSIGIGGLCTGAWLIADAGLLDGRRCAIHWENLPSFQERFPEADVYADLFEVDGHLCTCAGGTAALDMMLHLIAQDHDDSLITRICEMALTDRVRNPHDRQRLPLRARLGIHNSKLLLIIEMMEANLAEPVSMDWIAKRVGLSRRQIERLFIQNLSRSPARYYLELRLDRARHLLIQTSMPIIEVAVACGFISASHFSRCYRELYGKSPQAERKIQPRLDEVLSDSAPSNGSHSAVA